MRQSSVLLLCLLFVPLFARAAPYCAAIRGNGENLAAHWAALARLTEENGLPLAVAGGSSATVTMFFLEALSANPAWTARAADPASRHAQAFLLKSLPEFVEQLARQDHLVDLYGFLQKLRRQDSETVGRILGELAGDGAFSRGDLDRVFRRYVPLLNPELVAGLLRAPKFFRPEAMDAVRAFGVLQATSDPHLFFRPGLADFKYFTLLLGAVADFYAGNTPEAGALARLANDCAEPTYGRAWEEAPGPCRVRFRELASGYLVKGEFPHRALFSPVGAHLAAYPSTAILGGAAALRFLDLKARYLAGEKSADYPAFHADDERPELRFGYWGDAAALSRIDRNLEPARRRGDEKARRFEALGPANWFEVLAASPAEPGLANVQRLPTGTTRTQVLTELKRPLENRWAGLRYDPARLSAGGWADLHPVGVLRASGCERVVYLTRRDGDALFSQQVFIRLSGSEAALPFWEKLGEQNDAGWPVSGAAAATAWNRLYNLANAQSSFRRAIAEADAVYCTDWNRYQVFHGEMAAMVREAYASPVFLKAGAPLSLQVNPPRSGNYPGCLTP